MTTVSGRVMAEPTRSLYLGARAANLAVQCGYSFPEHLKPSMNGLVRLSLRDSDIEAFISLCRDNNIKDFK